jgi:hypothetical protein
MSVTVATRTVVTFGDKPSGIWVLPNDNVVEIDGEPFVTLGYGGDRGFARFVGGDLGASNPLARFSWLGHAVQARNVAVDALLDKVASEKVMGHIAGQAVKNRQHFADHMPQLVSVALPQLTHDDVAIGPITAKFVCDLDRKSLVQIECTPRVLEYVKVAMQAHKQSGVVRCKPKHADRLAIRTGVKGVWSHGKDYSGNPRVSTTFVDGDGKTRTKARRVDDEGPLDETCKRLKAKVSALQPQHAHELHGGVDHGTEDAVEDAVEDDADEGVDANGGAADCASPPDAEPSPVEAAAHQQAGLTDAWKNVFKR